MERNRATLPRSPQKGLISIFPPQSSKSEPPTHVVKKKLTLVTAMLLAVEGYRKAKDLAIPVDDLTSFEELFHSSPDLSHSSFHQEILRSNIGSVGADNDRKESGLQQLPISNKLLHNRLVPLDKNSFMSKCFHHLNGAANPNQLDRLFRDIDIDLTKVVSWDDFTTFLLIQAATRQAVYERSRFYLSSNMTRDITNSHRDSHAKLICRNEFVFSGSHDGFVKIWSTKDGNHFKTIPHFKYSPLFCAINGGTAASVSPIIDLSFVHGCGGSHITLLATSSDKSIIQYEAPLFHVTRRFIGRGIYNDIDTQSKRIGDSRDPVDTLVLLGMNHSLCSLDGTEDHLLAACSNGGILVYSSMKHGMICEAMPISTSLHPHEGGINKVRYIPEMNFILSAGWDKNLVSSNLETGQTMVKYKGGPKYLQGHTKAPFTFEYSQRTGFFVSIAAERQMLLWSPTSDCPIGNFGPLHAPVCDVALNEHEYQVLAMYGDNVIEAWDIRQQRVIQRVTHMQSHTYLSAVTFDPARNQIWALGGSLFSWQSKKAQSGYHPEYQGHVEAIVAIALLSNFKCILTCDSTTYMNWDMRSGSRLYVVEVTTEPDAVGCTAVDASNRRFVVTTLHGVVKVFNTRNGQLLRQEAVGTRGAITVTFISIKTIVYKINRPTNNINNAVVDGSESRSQPQREILMTTFTVVLLTHTVVLLRHRAERTDFDRQDIGISQDRSFCTMISGEGCSAASLLCGTVCGCIALISATSATVLSWINPPLSPSCLLSIRTESFFNACLTETEQGSIFSGSMRSSASAIECLLYLNVKDLLVTVMGTNKIFFWDILFCNKMVRSKSTSSPAQSFVCVAADPSNICLLAGDDNGVVRMYDLGPLRRNLKGTEYGDDDEIQEVRQFQIERCPVVKLEVALSSRVFIALSSSNSVRVLSLMDGSCVGSFGMENSWSLPKVDGGNMGQIFAHLETDMTDVSTRLSFHSRHSLIKRVSMSEGSCPAERKTLREDGGGVFLTDLTEFMMPQDGTSRETCRNRSNRFMHDCVTSSRKAQFHGPSSRHLSPLRNPPCGDMMQQRSGSPNAHVPKANVLSPFLFRSRDENRRALVKRQVQDQAARALWAAGSKKKYLMFLESSDEESPPLEPQAIESRIMESSSGPPHEDEFEELLPALEKESLFTNFPVSRNTTRQSTSDFGKRQPRVVERVVYDRKNRSVVHPSVLALCHRAHTEEESLRRKVTLPLQSDSKTGPVMDPSTSATARKIFEAKRQDPRGWTKTASSTLPLNKLSLQDLLRGGKISASK